MMWAERNAEVICAECGHFDDEHDGEQCWRTLTVAAKTFRCDCETFESLAVALA
jgi:hypothetical protein